MLDKGVKQFLDKYKAQNNPPYSSFKPAALRAWFNDQFKKKEKPKPIEVSRIEEHFIPNGNEKLQCRVYYPKKNGVLPVWIYFHGGGFVIRDNMDIYDQTCRMICAGTDCVVIAINFRLAPEHPFPAAPNDCYHALSWVFKQSNTLGVNSKAIGVWGESCGGNLATVIPMMARDKQGPKIKCQVIITAMLDINFTTNSYLKNGQGDYFLTQDSMQWFWSNYIKNKNDLNNPYCIPLKSKDLSGLPNTLLVTVEYDPLRDEGENYANQLKSAGVQTQHLFYKGLIHGFFDLYLISKTANKACKEIIASAKQLITD